MRALITGGTGFFGRSLRRHLQAERPRWEVFTLDRRPSPEKRHLVADLTSRSQTRRAVIKARPDLIFHMAGGTKGQNWPELWSAHVLGTAQLMDAVVALPQGRRPKVIVAGSAHEYGYPPALPTRETTIPRPVSPYGWSKLIESHTALAYAGMGAQVVIARVFNIVGPGLPESHALSSFCRQVALAEKRGSGEIVARGHSTASRDFVDVRDVCRALVLLASRGAPGEVYNVCSGRTTPILSIMRLLQRMARVPVSIRTQDQPRKTLEHASAMRGSYAKLRSRTGWRPALSLRQSLAQMLAEWRSRALS